MSNPALVTRRFPISERQGADEDLQGREKKLNKFDQSGMSMEELERLQAEQFAAAAARHN